MNSHLSYRVVGVRPNGERIVISETPTRAAAEKVIRLIRGGSPFKTLLIEFKNDGDWLQAPDGAG